MAKSKKKPESPFVGRWHIESMDQWDEDYFNEEIQAFIEYEANGLKYQTLSRRGLTIIVTRMPNHVAGFGLFQVSIANGSEIYWTVQPEDFSYINQEVSTAAISAIFSTT